MFKKLFVIFLLVAMATSALAENLPPAANESGLPTPTPPNSSTPTNESSTSEETDDGSSGSGGGSSGGGGGGGSSGGSGSSSSGSTQVAACVSDWICEPWSACEQSTQSRKCFDANGCSIPTNEPSSERACEAALEEVVPTQVEVEEVLPSQDESSSSMPLILGVSLGILILIGIAIFAFLYYQKPVIRKGAEFNKLVDFVHKNQHLDPKVIEDYATQSGWKPTEVEKARNRVKKQS